MPRYLTPTNTYDRAAIMRAAWFQARETAKYNPFLKQTSTPRAKFAMALRNVWNSAKAERALALWAAERDANAAVDAARRAALTHADRRIEDARRALMLAEHNDSVTSHVLVTEARAQLDAALQLAA